jgi:hypothetical protein
MKENSRIRKIGFLVEEQKGAACAAPLPFLHEFGCSGCLSPSIYSTDLHNREDFTSVHYSTTTSLKAECAGCGFA